jgi:hypothetical protein
MGVEDPVDILITTQKIIGSPYCRWMNGKVHRNRASNQRPEHVTSNVPKAERRDILTVQSLRMK